MGKSKNSRPSGVEAIFAGGSIKKGNAYGEIIEYIEDLERIKDELASLLDEINYKKIIEPDSYKKI